MARLGVLDARALVSYARLADLAPGAGGSAGAAGAALRRALDLDPSNAAAAASYARLLHREGNMAAAADWYRCSLSGDDPSPVSGDEPPEQSGLTTVGNASHACAQDKGHTRAQHPEAMAGYAALLLTHPALGHARSDDWRSAAPRRGDGSSFAEAEACRLLAQAAALAPASPAVVDGMQCLLTTALQRWSDANVAELMCGHAGGGLSRSEGRWAPLIEESMRQLERRVDRLAAQHADAVQHLVMEQGEQQPRRQPHVRPRGRGEARVVGRGWCLCRGAACGGPGPNDRAAPRDRRYPGRTLMETPGGDSDPSDHAASPTGAQRCTAAHTAANAHTSHAAPRRPQTLLASASRAGADADASERRGGQGIARCHASLAEGVAMSSTASGTCERRTGQGMARGTVEMLERDLDEAAGAAARLRWLCAKALLRIGEVEAAEVHLATARHLVPGFRPALVLAAQLLCTQRARSHSAGGGGGAGMRAGEARRWRGDERPSRRGAWLPEARAWHARLAYLSCLYRAGLGAAGAPPSASAGYTGQDLLGDGDLAGALDLAKGAFTAWPADPAAALSRAAQATRQRGERALHARGGVPSMPGSPRAEAAKALRGMASLLAGATPEPRDAHGRARHRRALLKLPANLLRMRNVTTTGRRRGMHAAGRRQARLSETHAAASETQLAQHVPPHGRLGSGDGLAGRGDAEALNEPANTKACVESAREGPLARGQRRPPSPTTPGPQQLLSRCWGGAAPASLLDAEARTGKDEGHGARPPAGGADEQAGCQDEGQRDGADVAMGETPAVEDVSEGPAAVDSAEEESVGEGSSSAQERAWAQMPREVLLELRYNLTQQLRLFPPQGSQQQQASTLNNTPAAHDGGRQADTPELANVGGAHDAEVTGGSSAACGKGPRAADTHGEGGEEGGCAQRRRWQEGVSPAAALARARELAERDAAACTIAPTLARVATACMLSTSPGPGREQPVPPHHRVRVSGLAPGPSNRVITQSMGASPLLQHMDQILAEVAQAEEALETRQMRAANVSAAEAERAAAAVNMEVLDQSDDDIIEMDLQRLEAGDPRLAAARSLEHEVHADPTRVFDADVREVFHLAPPSPPAQAELPPPPPCPSRASSPPCLRAPAPALPCPGMAPADGAGADEAASEEVARGEGGSAAAGVKTLPGGEASGAAEALHQRRAAVGSPIS